MFSNYIGFIKISKKFHVLWLWAFFPTKLKSFNTETGQILNMLFMFSDNLRKTDFSPVYCNFWNTCNSMQTKVMWNIHKSSIFYVQPGFSLIQVSQSKMQDICLHNE